MHANNQKKPIQPKMTFSDFTWKIQSEHVGCFLYILCVVYGEGEEENPHIQNEKKQ